MNSAASIIRRWQAMDLALTEESGLVVSQFAKQWKVSERTVRRDLEALRELGKEIVPMLDGNGRYLKPNSFNYVLDQYQFEDPLFCSTLRSRLLSGKRHRR